MHADTAAAAGAHCVRTGTVGGVRAARWAAIWSLLAEPEVELHERTMKQTVDGPVPHVELAVSSGGAGSSWPGADDTASAAATAAAKSVGEAHRTAQCHDRSRARIFW